MLGNANTFALDLDCKQSFSGQTSGCAHSVARLERGEINEKRLGQRREGKGLHS